MVTWLVKREITGLRKPRLRKTTTRQHPKIVSPLIINSSIGTGIDKTLKPNGPKSKQL